MDAIVMPELSRPMMGTGSGPIDGPGEGLGGAISMLRWASWSSRFRVVCCCSPVLLSFSPVSEEN